MVSGATVLFLLACTADPGGSGDSAAVDDCADVEVSWNNWGFAFFSNYCRSCHSVDAPDRYGAPAGVDFDSIVDVRTWAERIRITVLDDESMPIGGGVPDLELERLDQLLSCGL